MKVEERSALRFLVDDDTRMAHHPRCCCRRLFSLAVAAAFQPVTKRAAVNRVVQLLIAPAAVQKVKDITGVVCRYAPFWPAARSAKMDVASGSGELRQCRRERASEVSPPRLAVGRSDVPWYFGYATNMDLISLRAKGIEPRMSMRAVLPGWRLRFNVRHFFRHEGGVANIERSDEPTDAVWGVLHLCDDTRLALLDAAEAIGHGYNRISIRVFTQRGEHEAATYVGIPSFIHEGCRPSRRYLNILIRGATQAGIDSDYVDALRRHPVHQPPTVPVFVPPPGDYPIFTAATLIQHPMLTALAGAVFDMAGARWQHHC